MKNIVNIFTTVGLAAVVFFALSAITMIVVGPDNTASQVQAHHGDIKPPWVNDDGTIDKGRVPDRMPVPDGNGGIIGYVEIDMNPNDDPEPGDLGFEEWNTTQTVYASETGNEIVGKVVWDGPGGVRDFRPVEDEEPPESE